MAGKLLMDKTYQFRELYITITIEEGIVRIKNDVALWLFVSKDIKERTDWLIDCMLIDYATEIGKPLKIHSRSIAIEIWGHLYYEYFILLICHYLAINPSIKRIKRLLRSSEIIDCGEKCKDSNRFLWDFLTPFYKIIYFLLPKNIMGKNLKR